MNQSSRRNLHIAFTVCLLGAVTARNVAGQGITATLKAATPLVAHATALGQNNTVTQPVGALPQFGDIESTLGTPAAAHALVNWYHVSSPTEVTVSLTNSLVATGGPSSLASTGAEFLVELTSATPRTMQIDFEGSVANSIGAAWPELSVDVGNDGVVNHHNLPLSGPATLGTVTITQQPTVLRVIMSADVDSSEGSQTSSTQFWLTARPANAVSIVPTAVGCLGSSPLNLTPVFADRGIDMTLTNSLVVIGANAQPTLWGPQSPVPFATTCLVMPSPDIVLWHPFGVFHIPLPASVRPLTFEIQAVSVSSLGFATTDAYQVQAF